MKTNVPLREREGFNHLAMRAMYFIAYPFFHCKCHWTKEVRQAKDPIIFVCNHYEMFGPLSVVVSMRTDMRFWMSDMVLHASENQEALATGMHEAMTRLAQEQIDKLFNHCAHFAEKVFKRMDPIPVDRENPMKLLSTLRKSVETMKNGNNVVIFPETGIPHYSIGSVTPFFDGFAMLGEFYRRSTGKNAQFCPVYVDKWNRSLRMGKIVTYQQGDITAENHRVAQELHDQLLDMARLYHPELPEFQPEEEEERLYSEIPTGEENLAHR